MAGIFPDFLGSVGTGTGTGTSEVKIIKEYIEVGGFCPPPIRVKVNLVINKHKKKLKIKAKLL